MNSVDPTLIGEKIGAGLQHHVFAYDTDWVIKMPRLWVRLSFHHTDKEHELTVLQRHVRDFIPETYVVPYKKSYCYIQKRVFGGTSLSLEHSHITTPAFLLLKQHNHTLIETEHRSLDFIGFQTYTLIPRAPEHRKHMHLNNVILHPEAPHGIYLLDTDTLYTNPFRATKASHLIFAFLSFFVHIYTIVMLKLYRVHIDR